MSGTLQGGIKAAKTNKLLHGKDFYARIGKLGGSAKVIGKGFAGMPKDKLLAAVAKGVASRKNKYNAH